MNSMYRVAIASLAAGVCAASAPADDLSPIVATLSSGSQYVLPGSPVWVDFTVTNTSDEAVELAVPGTRPLPSSGLVGLPVSHVFSGPGFSALSIRGQTRQVWEVATGYHPPAAAESLILGPHASVGIGVDVTEYYRVLSGPGLFRLRWTPYGGAFTSNELIIEIAAPKEALIQTDLGTMRVRFHYPEAPNHIANFLELARSGFYDNLRFQRIVPGYCIQGGCPNGDGTGIRPDGLKLDAELADRTVERGSVCMARLENDLNSASCQFFICNTRVPQWDGRYTLFGELTGADSLTTLDALMSQATDEQGRPVKPLLLRAIRVVDAPAKTPLKGTTP